MMMTRFQVICAVGVSISMLGGCLPKDSEVAATPSLKINQESLCQVDSWQHDAVASLCSEGQKVVFLPNSFGNEQLPIIFSAVNCDLRYTVALTKGGVTCIYKPIVPTPPAAQSKGSEGG